MKSFRKERIAGLVQEIVTDAIARKISDPRVSPLTTVTRVKMTGDLLVATVYLTVAGDDDVAERTTVRAMQHAAAFVRGMLAKELGMRSCPEVRFEADEQLKKVKHVMGLIGENRRNRPDLYDTDEPPTERDEKEFAGDDSDPAGEVQPRSEE